MGNLTKRCHYCHQDYPLDELLPKEGAEGGLVFICYGCEDRTYESHDDEKEKE